jgi:hypothetical protein
MLGAQKDCASFQNLKNCNIRMIRTASEMNTEPATSIYQHHNPVSPTTTARQAHLPTTQKSAQHVCTSDPRVFIFPQWRYCVIEWLRLLSTQQPTTRERPASFSERRRPEDERRKHSWRAFWHCHPFLGVRNAAAQGCSAKGLTRMTRLCKLTPRFVHRFARLDSTLMWRC